MKTRTSHSKLHLHAALVLAVIAALLAAGAGWAAPILLDPSFDLDGKVVTDTGGVTDEAARAIYLYPTGRILVAGYTETAGNHDFALVRYNKNGVLDPTFGGTAGHGIVRTDINRGADFGLALAVQPDGRIVVAGESNGDVALVRYLGNGSRDESFDGDGIVVTSLTSGDEIAYGVAIQPDGKIVVAGTIYPLTAAYDRVFVARYNSNGSLDTSFNRGGWSELHFSGMDASAHALALQPDGKILLAGPAGGDFFVWRFLSNGGNDFNFFGGRTDIRGGNDEANALVIQPDGRIIVVGEADSVPTGDYDFAMVRFNTNGTLDNSFGQDGKVLTNFNQCSEWAYAVALQMDGRIVTAGDVLCLPSDASDRSVFPRDFMVTRHNIDGSLDASFNGIGFVTANINIDDMGKAVAIQPDGKIVVAGGSDADFSVARFGGTALAFTSNASQDGWVLETQENSSVGGSSNRGSPVIFVGDDALNRQYRGILSFDTAPLPDNAIFSSVTLMLKRQVAVGTDPLTTHGSLIADVRTGFFHLGSVIEAADFQAPAHKNNIGKFLPVTGNPGWYQLVLTAVNYPYINLAGLTQFRLRFTLDDNNNLTADYLKIFSGDYANATFRPMLVIEYTLP